MKGVLAGMAILGVVGMTQAQTTAVSGLKAVYRHGQVFLTWQERSVLKGTTFSVYMSDAPITAGSLGRATKVCEWIGPLSAEDWWLSPYAFGRDPKPDPKTGKPPEYKPKGFLIETGGKRLDPASGLHVHTVAPDEAGPRYYAVTTTHGGKENRTITPGANALGKPIRQKAEPIRPIWQGKPDTAPKVGAGKDKPVMLQLHAKGNRRATSFLVFGSAEHAWRQGVPFKFDLAVAKTRVTLLPSDTMYVGRPFKKARDGRNRNKIAIFTFWYGCSDQVYFQERIGQGTPTDYSQRRLLWLLDWTRGHLKTDPNRVYCSGSSMGGCGAMGFAFRHPEIFAALYASVPIVAYTEGDPAKGRKLGQHSNSYRLTGFCGPLALKCSDGMTLQQRLDAGRFALSHPGDLPFLVIANGRQDGSIPWHNNPDFYRALQKMRHGCLVAWNDGAHSKVHRTLPPDIRPWTAFDRLARFALNKSYPAFSRCSRDGDPGNGDSNHGDIESAMNRGLDWKDVRDTPKRYEVTILYGLAAADLPLTVDVTPRRVQAFKLTPGEACEGVNLDASGKEIQRVALRADDHGLFTFPAFQLTAKKGNRLVLAR